MLLINVLTGMPVVTLVAFSQKYTSSCSATLRAFGGVAYLRGLPIGRFASSALFVIVVPFRGGHLPSSISYFYVPKKVDYSVIVWYTLVMRMYILDSDGMA